MRLILGLGALIVLFALLVRAMPSSWSIPLYILFVTLTVAFTGWERKRISQKRRKLEQQLLQGRDEVARRQKQAQDEANGTST